MPPDETRISAFALSDTVRAALSAPAFVPGSMSEISDEERIPMLELIISLALLFERFDDPPPLPLLSVLSSGTGSISGVISGTAIYNPCGSFSSMLYIPVISRG